MRAQTRCGFDLKTSARRIVSALVCVSACLLLLGSVHLHAATFKVAVAKTDITPPPGLPMYGFLDRIKDRKLSTGTLDPLYARVLVLEVGARRLALVTLDLGRTF